MSMGVYIDIEMPKEGFVEILIRDDGTVQQTGQSYRIDGTDYYTPYVGEMPKMFTAIPVPAHGRLGDLDELHKEAVRRSEKAGTYDSWYNCADRVISAFDIENARTIISASEEGEL